MQSGNWRPEGSLSFKERNTLRSNLGFIYKGRPHEGGGGLANCECGRLC